MGTLDYGDCWTYPLVYLKKALGELDAAIDALDTRVTALEDAEDAAETTSAEQ